MNISLKTRLAAIIGLPEDASEDSILAATKELAKAAAKDSVESEYDRKVRSIMEDANCTRGVAAFAIAEQSRYDAAHQQKKG
jgi:hypothetical protein